MFTQVGGLFNSSFTPFGGSGCVTRRKATKFLVYKQINQIDTTFQLTGWPDNKEKCTNLFNYCITYVDKHNNTGNNNNNNNGLKDDDPFVVKVSRAGTN